MHDSGAVDDLAAQVAELMPAASAAGFAGPREPGERAGATAISRRTAGVALAGAAAGMVGAAVLSDRSGRSAAAPSGGGVRAELTAVDTPAATTPGRAGGISPAVVTLADEARISVDAALGNDFRITLEGERIIANPVGGEDGQRITFMITQGPDSHFKVIWSRQYKFGEAGAPELSETPGSTDIVGFIYNESLGSWLCTGSALGF